MTLRNRKLVETLIDRALGTDAAPEAPAEARPEQPQESEES
jgi:hypothetical protein